MDSSIISEESDHPSHEHTHDEEASKMLGFIVFLLSETFIFLGFFTAYIVYKTANPDWLPAGVSGLEVRDPAINTVILVSSSFCHLLGRTRPCTSRLDNISPVSNAFDRNGKLLFSRTSDRMEPSFFWLYHRCFWWDVLLTNRFPRFARSYWHFIADTCFWSLFHSW